MKQAMAKKSETYHHGDLRAALLRAAEEILEIEGVGALSARACARRIGVSHSAPIHHFPTLAALLSELAANGYERLAQALRSAMSKEGSTPIDVGMAYVAFAKENKPLFLLMNDPTRLDSTNPTLQFGRRRVYEVIGNLTSISLAHPTLEQVGQIAGRWAIAHGLTILLLTGRLGGLLKMAPEGTTEIEIVESAFLAMSRD
jgi:AcrR family transcriptional regulator